MNHVLQVALELQEFLNNISTSNWYVGARYVFHQHNRYRYDCELGGLCLLYTSDAADERSSVDLGGRRIIKKKKRGGWVGTRDLSEARGRQDTEGTRKEAENTQKYRTRIMSTAEEE